MSLELLNNNVGKYWRRLSISIQNLDVIGDSPADIDERMKRLAKKVEAAVKSEFPIHDDINEPGGIVRAFSDAELVLDAKDRSAELDKSLADLRAIFADSKARLDEEMANHPDNGKDGYWSVVGIRHDAIVKASSAPDAIKKAIDEGAVGDWEIPSADFIGETIRTWCDYRGPASHLEEWGRGIERKG